MTRRTPRISIITPTYNRAYILEEAINSVLSQTYSDWRLLLVDDGSTDGTAQLVSRFQDRRIEYLPKEHAGQIEARNYALERVETEWVVYLDSDNQLFPHHFETVLSWIDRYPTTVWGFPRGTRIQELYQEGVRVETVDDSDDFPSDPSQVTPQAIFHRELHTDMNGAFHHRQIIDDGIRFDPKIRKMEDWDLFLTLSTRYPHDFLYIPELLYDYRQRYGTDGLVSNSTYSDWAALFEAIYQKHRHSPLMKGQRWYPSRVKKWQQLSEQYAQGKIGEYHEYYFRSGQRKHE